MYRNGKRRRSSPRMVRPAALPGSIPRSRARRAARTSVLASSQIFTSASGSTTVPMSRPATTIPPRPTSARWRARSAARTCGARATAETTRSTSGVRIAVLTSWPPMTTRSSRPPTPATTVTDGASAASVGPSSGSTPRWMAAHASARYRSPESKKRSPRAAATAAPTELLPDEPGPSSAITGRRREVAGRGADSPVTASPVACSRPFPAGTWTRRAAGPRRR